MNPYQPSDWTRSSAGAAVLDAATPLAQAAVNSAAVARIAPVRLRLACARMSRQSAA